jgi:hypothetical protein
MLGSFFTLKRLIFYGFPLYLTGAEYAMRFLMQSAPGRPEDISILAASNGIAAAGLSLIAPVLLPKPIKTTLSEDALALLMEEGAQIVNRRDQTLIVFGWLGLLVLPFPWGVALWLTHSESTAYDLHISPVTLPGPFVIALLIYLVGMIYTELKELA